MHGTAQTRVRIKGTKVYPLEQPRARASVDYDGASTAKRIARWTFSSSGPNAALGGSISTLRGRSRDILRKDGLADRGVEVLVNNVIGTGIKPQFNTPDQTLNKRLTDLWLEWTDEADADGRCDFYGLQALAFRSMLEAGDVFARMRTRRREDGLSVPLQLQLLESEFCPVEKTETRPNGGYITQGVEFNVIGRRVAYWMYRLHPNDGLFTGQNFSDMPVPVPASEVAQMSSSRRPGVVRGEPWLVRALIKLYELDQCDDATLLRMKIGNMYAGFVSPSATMVNPTDDEDGVAIAPLEPGTMQVLPPGSTLAMADPPEAGSQYDAFMLHQERRVATSLGILYEQLSGDYSKVNDRTWRAAMNEFKRGLERLQHQIVVFQLCRPIMRRWCEYVAIQGIIPPALVAIAARPKWLPQAHAYINPVQDVQAKRDEVRAGFKSRSQVVSEAGDDAAVVDAEIAADNKRADGLELRFDSDGRTDLKGGNPDEDAPEPVAPVQPQARAEAQPITVNVAPPAVHVAPAAVTVEAPVVNVAPATVNVSPPAIHVDANFHAAPKGKIIKEVSAYDDKGRIIAMTEREED